MLIIQHGYRAIFLSATTALALSMPAYAQEGETESRTRAAFGEIVVTARSQAESLMSVPVAVTALTAEDVQRYATSDLIKLAHVRPDVEIYSGGSRAGAAFVIRGIGTTADTAGVESSVSIALDGVQTHRPRVVYQGMFDIAQVEIMKGPQALFFGKNSSAGVVSIKTMNPGTEVGGFVRGGYEFESHERYAEAAVDIPISETLRTRFAGRYSKMRGWIKNIAEAQPDPQNPAIILPAPHHRYNGGESLAGRVTVLWEPSPIYSSVFKATFTEYENHGPTADAETVCKESQAISLGFYINPLTDCRLNGVTAINDLPPTYTRFPPGTGPGFNRKWENGIPYAEASTTLLTWEQNLDLGQVGIRSITGHSKLSYDGRGNFNYAESAPFSGGSFERFSGWSQELRAVTQFEGRFNLTVGGFWEKAKLFSGSPLLIAQLGPDPTTGSYLSGIDEARENQRTFSFFGQARYDVIPDELELAVGARYTKVKKRASQGQAQYVHDILELIGALLPEGVTMQDRLTEDNWSPEASLTWTPNPDTTLYAAFKTGYKVGGIAQPALVTPANIGNVLFEPEKSRGGEIGYKGYLADRRIRMSATAFYYKFKGLQITSFDPLISAYRIRNAADVKQHGIEGDFEFRATDELTLRAAAAYVRAKYGDFPLGNCYANQLASEGCIDPDGPGPLPAAQDFTGKQLHRAPKFVATTGFTYDMSIGSALRFGISGDMRYRSGTHVQDVQNPVSYQKGHAQFHTSARLYDESVGWELAFIGRNLTNKRAIGFANDRPGAITPGRPEVSAYVVRGRELALQGTFKF